LGWGMKLKRQSLLGGWVWEERQPENRGGVKETDSD
jgi:hypothetical protein